MAGVYAATPCPLTGEFEIDRNALGATLNSLCSSGGLAGFLINGHAGENTSMALDDQVEVARYAVDCVPKPMQIVAGVNCENALQAARHARDLEQAGVDALMVFPPNGWALFKDQGAALDLHRRVVDSCDLPIFLFQASVAAGSMRYRPDELAELASISRIVGVKEGSWEVAAYEESRRAVKAVNPHIAVMGSGDEHLFTSYAIGSEGALVSLAAVVPEPIVALHTAVSSNDWASARQAHERIYPIARAIYRDAPGGRANARLKTCLKLRGLFETDAMLPPTQSTPAAELDNLRSALQACRAQ